jgi:GNAT superfamily N-acetyltransferase
VNDAPEIRVATSADLPALSELIPLSVRGLSRGFYSDAQIESAIRHIFGPDTQLIADRTYFVAIVGGVVVGCGGWSRRRTLFGGDQMKTADDPLLDPNAEPARIRAFFVHPDWARRGIGGAILDA